MLRGRRERKLQVNVNTINKTRGKRTQKLIGFEQTLKERKAARRIRREEEDEERNKSARDEREGKRLCQHVVRAVLRAPARSEPLVPVQPGTKNSRIHRQFKRHTWFFGGGVCPLNFAARTIKLAAAAHLLQLRGEQAGLVPWRVPSVPGTLLPYCGLCGIGCWGQTCLFQASR